MIRDYKPKRESLYRPRQAATVEKIIGYVALFSVGVFFGIVLVEGALRSVL